MADFQNIFNDDEAGSERANSITSSDLDPFLLQGDDQTWAVEDWNWDPFNMFAAPKEVPNVACCQALKRRKMAEHTATSGAPVAQQQQHAACAPGHGAHGGASRPAAGAAGACCSALQGHNAQQAVAGPLQTALQGMMQKPETCGGASMACHGPMLAPPPPMPVAAQVAAAGGPHMQMGMGMGQAHMAWPGMPDLSNPGSVAAAAAAAAAAAPNFFGGGGQLAAMGWGAQAMALQMPGLGLPGFPGHAQCAPAMAMPAMQGPTSGIFNQQASIAVPSALPSPALGSTNDTTSLQASADNAKPPCCSGNRNMGPTCSGGRQQADSSNKAPPPAPKGQHGHGHHGGPAAIAGEMSDFAISDSEDEEEVARRAPAPARGPAQAPQHPVLGDVVALNDVYDDGLMVCQVPGCGKDLTNLKEYHQRYRICDVHIKLQQVMKDGRLQRFCQQCGRFHDLTAFDGNRKSCRDQLSKHNARRRRRAQAEQAKGKAATADAGAAGAAAAAAAAVGAGGVAFDGDVGKLLACLMQSPAQLHALRLLLGVPTHPALPTPGGAMGLGAMVASPESGSDGSDQARTYGLARDILAGRNEFSPAFESEHRMIRLSMKLFNKTPADLPADLRNQVTSWLASAPLAMEASIRPGCVFLTVQVLVDERGAAQAEAPDALPAFAEHLLTRTGCPFWHSGTYTLQLGTDLLLVREGKVDPAGVSRGDGRFPVVRRLGPLAAVAGQPVVLKLHGNNLDASGCSVILRWGNRHLKAHVQALSAHRAVVRLPPLPDVCGPVWVEVSRGAYLSPAKQLLVARDEVLVEELNKLDVRGGPIPTHVVEALMQDMAIVLQHIAGQPGVAAQLPHAAVALKARRLLAMACDMGWAAVASAVLPLACARCSCAAEMVAAIHAASVPSAAAAGAAAGSEKEKDSRGLTLLHRAVRSGSIPLLAGMLAWGDSHGYRWRVDAAGPAGITPLHLAAMLDDARVGLLLLDHCGWPAAFTHLRTDTGVTPFHLGFQMGHYQVDTLMSALGGLHQVVDLNNQQPAPPPPPPPPARRSRCGAVVGCKPDDDEDVKPDVKTLGGGGGKGHHGSGSCSEIDPCEQCHCTLPPLLLSIMASCNDCGRRRMCMDAETAVATTRAGECGCGGARPSMRADSGEVCCSRGHTTIFSITALCQGCHANRQVLAAA
ncbi:hypothetical protein HYH03_015369 [Edaphochlamys debaryana]|uniref:SBP-type domain-containing protein n=1 Tax=Edaphochlamys debaryana TaxID=47281 RepID=A0A835XM14_9CHLO|nr:hypothetical protein HYH03_015369 [Edaphochlamys debaryana]|eukprot:KAG2485925.1 hypothetical protein HYH03_015369 [Edaphochlamys debaryana]